MKTRSEWTFDDWTNFGYGLDHRFNLLKAECILIHGCTYTGISENDLDEAARISVEKYCKENSVPLPWKPDYDLSTVEGCEEAIKSCGYKVNIPRLAGLVTVIQLEDATRTKNINASPTLEQWQEAAQFAIDNHEH